MGPRVGGASKRWRGLSQGPGKARASLNDTGSPGSRGKLRGGECGKRRVRRAGRKLLVRPHLQQPFQVLRNHNNERN